ncbi:putative 15-hydroxyprostaglandin dehydrogenase [Penaeus vannamei]|uniref:15-hydroxyprostaglandin dehydrogenase [NAD(+)] n=1 Tax=Penaeus vannamei TaxID=6689 RepID=A0A3R7M5H1_PENVA|nr:putative 15-hydroxyprostaglandin dehydrogenase [Penaeus vannamei]
MGGCCTRSKTLETAVQRPPVAMQIQGSVVLITGAARGLGRCFAETLLGRGAKVCLTDIDAEAGAETVTELQAQHGGDNAMFFKCDVTKDEDFNGAWDAAVEKFGPVTLLVNNAGLGNEQNWQLTLNVNIRKTEREAAWRSRRRKSPTSWNRQSPLSKSLPLQEPVPLRGLGVTDNVPL